MPHMLLIESRFYSDISDLLTAGAVKVLEAENSTYDKLTVPGAFEIPAAIAMAMDSARYDGFIALGCVIRGETSHYDYVCGESARGLMDLALKHRAAIGYGILTVDNREQALARAGGARGNKGEDAARACLALHHVRQQFAEGA